MFISGIVTSLAGFAQNFSDIKDGDVQWTAVIQNPSVMVGIGVRFDELITLRLSQYMISLTGVLLCGGGLGWLCCTVRYSKQNKKIDLETIVASKC